MPGLKAQFLARMADIEASALSSRAIGRVADAPRS